MLPVLKHVMSYLDPVRDVTAPFHDTITDNSLACFWFLLSHPALDVTQQTGMFFKHAIYHNRLYMLARLCCHPTVTLDEPFLRKCVDYASSRRNYAAATFLITFLCPVET